MKVSVIIPVYNRAGLIRDIIDALLSQKIPPFEIIIVDDGSTDNLMDAVKDYPVRYVYQENRGPASARNLGSSLADGDILAFIDSDCIPEKDWLLKLIEGFDNDMIGVVAGSYSIANPESLLSRLIHEEIKWRHMRFGIFIKAFGSYNFGIRKKLFEEIGGFDESYRRASGEDNDLSYRVIKAGYKIRFLSDCLVRHYHTENLFRYLREQWRHGYWRMKVYRDHPDMMKGDDYTSLKDILELPFSFFVVAGIPLFFSSMWFIETGLLFFLAGLSIPCTVEITWRKKRLEYLLLIPLSTIRSFARLGGMLSGLYRFRLRS